MLDFVIPTEKISWGKGAGQVVEVRGLSFNDFTQLFVKHGKGLDQLFNFIEAGAGQLEAAASKDIKTFGSGFIMRAPELVAQLIAVAADSPDQAPKVAQLPLPVQIKCLEAIYRMTVEEAGGLADFMQLVLRIAEEVRITARAINPKTPLESIGT